MSLEPLNHTLKNGQNVDFTPPIFYLIIKQSCKQVPLAAVWRVDCGVLWGWGKSNMGGLPCALSGVMGPQTRAVLAEMERRPEMGCRRISKAESWQGEPSAKDVRKGGMWVTCRTLSWDTRCMTGLGSDTLAENSRHAPRR